MDRINAFIKRVRLFNSLWAVVMIAVGVLLLLQPDKVLVEVCRVIGALMFVYGVFLVIHYLTNREARLGFFSTLALIGGAVFLAVGLFVLVRPRAIIDFASILFAFVMIMYGLEHLLSMNTLRKYQDSRWWTSLFGALITLGLGLLILINPFGSAKLVVRVAGGALIFTGLNGLFFNARTNHFARMFFRAQKNEYRDEVIDGDAMVSDIGENQEDIFDSEKTDF